MATGRMRLVPSVARRRVPRTCTEDRPGHGGEADFYMRFNHLSPKNPI